MAIHKASYFFFFFKKIGYYKCQNTFACGFHSDPLIDKTLLKELFQKYEHNLVDLYQGCSNNAPWIKIGPAPYISLYRKT